MIQLRCMKFAFLCFLVKTNNWMNESERRVTLKDSFEWNFLDFRHQGWCDIIIQNEGSFYWFPKQLTQTTTITSLIKCLHLLSRHVIRAMLIRLCFLSFIVFFHVFFLICWDIPLAAMPNNKLLMLRVGPGPLSNLYLLSPITRQWSLRYLYVYICMSLIIVVGRVHHKSAVYWINPAPDQQNPNMFPLSKCFCSMVGQRRISESSTP